MMAGVPLSGIDDDPSGYWRENKKEVIKALDSPDNIETLQHASYAFGMAAKKGAVQNMSPSLASTVGKCIDLDDRVARVNTIGGIGGTLIFGDSETRDRIINKSLVSDLTSATEENDLNVKENAFLTLSMVAWVQPSLIVENRESIHQCLENIESSGQCITYASLSLANIAYYESEAIATHFPRFSWTLNNTKLDGRQRAALVYCLSQTVPDRGLKRPQVETIKYAINQCCDFVLNGDPSPAVQALIVESLLPLAQRWPQEILNTKVTDLVESIISWGPSGGLDENETSQSKGINLSVGEAAIKLSLALPRSEISLDGELLTAIQTTTNKPEIEHGCKKLKQEAVSVSINRISEQIEDSVEHIDRIIQYKIKESTNVIINSPGASAEYYE